ncbi:Cytochrome P450 86A2 [Glycine soja]|uniref:Cytochrome P450 86A2 n=1 Tax=Glycine soja TaxID=3848 RepID=A0A0B2RIW6_GLYSO|nr:Cytochrome P450 86A2 [Glycine soja]
MLKTNFKNFPKEKNFSTILRDFLGKGIFNVHVDTWRFQKKMASLHLNNHSLVTSLAVKIINSKIKNMLTRFYRKTTPSASCWTCKTCFRDSLLTTSTDSPSGWTLTV